ncbi:MAG: ABC transporter ATP-binding protein [Actinobacteria bacterium]|nr:ABC transporter ATP-binding protein [Actinomycetota bacterium]
MSRLEIHDLHVDLGERTVLAGVDLEVESGTLAAILGPSGCGKTTLLRAIAGFVTPRRGTIRLGARVLVGPGQVRAPEARGVGLVPQEGALFPHLDVAANVAFGLPRRERRSARVSELLDLVGLSGYERARPHELSGGQQHRVALARALAPAPEMVLLDEPFAALDAALRGSLRAEVRSALATAGATALLVTHDQDEALSMADSVAVLQGGRIALHDSPVRVYEAPTDLSAARFLGELVELPADLVAGRARCALGDVEVAVASGVDEGPVVLGLRPEQLRLGVPGLPGVGGTAGIIRAREYFGHDCLLGIELPDGSVVRARVAGRPPLADEVQVYVVGPVRAYAR